MEAETASSVLLNMQQWTPLHTFGFSFLTAALSGLASLLWSVEPVPLRNLIKYPLYFGCAACGFGCLVYELPGFPANKPWRILGISFLIGLCVIKMELIGELASKVLQNLVRAFLNTGDK